MAKTRRTTAANRIVSRSIRTSRRTRSSRRTGPGYSRSHRNAKMIKALKGRMMLTSDKKLKASNKALRKLASQLKPVGVDFHIKDNRLAHRTDDYEAEHLIIRRGQTFDFTVTFNREYKPDIDNIVLQFEIAASSGSRPQESKGSIVRVAIQEILTPAKWGMRIKQIGGKTLRLTIMPSAKAPIGQYEVFVKTIMTDDKKSVFKYKDGGTVSVLFNAWCKEDSVYMAREDYRKEYVLNDFGYIWVGSAKRKEEIPWTFGQFEDVSLECALWLLNKTGLSATARSSPIQISRIISAMANHKDSDGGILFGRWTEKYPKNCTLPSAWTGSIAILEKFMRRKSSVRFGQCWVFSGLVTTVLRSLGLPTRSVTNYESAHDTDNSMTVDFHRDKEGNPLDKFNDDSIWDFHVWNESWFKRPDLPDGHDGWQVHDATPQETSEGVFRCGPASVKAVKNGEVYLPYDTGFVFAEVNSDRVNWDVDDDDGPMKVGYVEKHSIGMSISTKKPGKGCRRLDVTSAYKHPEGSRRERKAVEFAYKFSTRREYDIYNADKEDVEFSLEVLDDIAIGNSFDVKVVARNKSYEQRNVKVNITSVMAFYNRISAKPLKRKMKTIKIGPRKDNAVTLNIESGDYVGKIAADGNVKLYIKGTVQETGQSYATQDVVKFRKPKLTVTSSSKSVKRWEKVEVTASFKNILPFTLKNGKFQLEGAGLSPRSTVINLDFVASKEKAKVSATFTVTKSRNRTVVVSFQSDQLAGVRGECVINVT